MFSIDDLIRKAEGRFQVYKDYRVAAENDFTSKPTICIPDMHLLEKGPNDDFRDNDPRSEERFISFLDFLINLKKEAEIDIVQLGDMFDLWQAKGNTNLIVEAYPTITGLIQELRCTCVVGNHDIDLVEWYKNEKESFGRIWRFYSTVSNKKTVIYEHGFQADFANNQKSWTGVIGREITKVVSMMEYIYPDMDVILGSALDSILRIFKKYNVFTPVRDPYGFQTDQFLKYYLSLMKKYNSGKTLDAETPDEIDLRLAVFGHTHSAKLVRVPDAGRVYYLMDCGSWVNGGHEVGLIAANEIAVCRWTGSE
jgi:UDP-2,3-diacylglucosamine pyrophosphatase LpxH